MLCVRLQIVWLGIKGLSVSKVLITCKIAVLSYNASKRCCLIHSFLKSLCLDFKRALLYIAKAAMTLCTKSQP